MGNSITSAVVCLSLSILVGKVSAQPVTIYEPSTNFLFVPGVSVEEFGNLDLTFVLGENFELTLREAVPANLEIVKNSWIPETNKLEISELAFDADSFWLELILEQVEPVVTFSVGDNGRTIDLCQQPDWEVVYNIPDFSNNSLTIDCDGTGVIADIFTGTVSFKNGQLDMVFADGDITFSGNLPPKPGLCFDTEVTNFASNGSAKICPVNLGTTLDLLGGEYTLTVDWETATDSGSGKSIRLTEDSGVFIKSDPDDPDDFLTGLRILNSCNEDFQPGGIDNIAIFRDLLEEEFDSLNLHVVQNSTGLEKNINEGPVGFFEELFLCPPSP